MSWRRAAASAAVVGLFAVALTLALVVLDRQGARRSAPGAVTYAQLLQAPGQSIVGQIVEGIRRQSAEVGRLLVPGMFRTYARQGEWLNINTWVFSVVFLLVTIGWWKFVKRTADPLALTFPFHFAACVAWPVDTGTRLTAPMLPVLAASVWFVMEGLGKGAGGHISGPGGGAPGDFDRRLAARFAAHSSVVPPVADDGAGGGRDSARGEQHLGAGRGLRKGAASHVPGGSPVGRRTAKRSGGGLRQDTGAHHGA